MLIRYTSTVKVAIAFLRILGVKVNNATVNETLQSHPDWPSLLCISDSLQKWDMPNAAGKMHKEDIDQLPVPFIACLRSVENTVVVTQVTDAHVGYYSTEKGKEVFFERNIFLDKWDGVYLIAETNERSGEKNYNQIKRRLLFRSLTPLILLLLLIFLSFLGLQAAFEGNTGVAIYVQYGVYLAGTLISALLLWYETDLDNPLLKQVCSGLSKGNCEAILTGSHSKLFGRISWSEIGFFYFSGSFLTLLFAPDAVLLLKWLTLCTLPYIIFSIYYQWRVAKQWCILCLSVQALLLINGINTLTGHFMQRIVWPVNMLLIVVSCFLLPILCWYSLKPYFLRLQQVSTTRRKYNRLKFNPELFETLLKKQKAISVPATGLGIDLGKVDATNTLIKICNPYCDPCANVHPKIEKLLEEHDNLHVKVIFKAFSEKNDEWSHPTRHLMAIAEKLDDQLTKKALDDWYLAEKKDYALFAKQYPMNGELRSQGPKIDAMHDWCRSMNVRATPTFFFNGHQLPDGYTIDDLEYFLLE